MDAGRQAIGQAADPAVGIPEAVFVDIVRSRITRRSPAAISGPARPRSTVGRFSSVSMPRSTRAQSPMLRACTDMSAIASTISATVVDGLSSRGATGSAKSLRLRARRCGLRALYVNVPVSARRSCLPMSVPFLQVNPLAIGALSYRVPAERASDATVSANAAIVDISNRNRLANPFDCRSHPSYACNSLQPIM